MAVEAINTVCAAYSGFRSNILNTSAADFVEVVDVFCAGTYDNLDNPSFYAVISMLAPVMLSVGYLVYNKISKKCQTTSAETLHPIAEPASLG